MDPTLGSLSGFIAEAGIQVGLLKEVLFYSNCKTKIKKKKKNGPIVVRKATKETSFMQFLLSFLLFRYAVASNTPGLL